LRKLSRCNRSTPNIAERSFKDQETKEIFRVVGLKVKTAFAKQLSTTIKRKFQLKFKLTQLYLWPTIVCLASVSDRVIHCAKVGVREKKKSHSSFLLSSQLARQIRAKTLFTQHGLDQLSAMFAWQQCPVCLHGAKGFYVRVEKGNLNIGD